MAKAPKDDPAQSQRFIDVAREVKADEDREAFERTFTKVASPKVGHSSPEKKPSVTKKHQNKP